MTRFALLTEFAPPDHGGIQATVGPIIEALGDNVTVIAPQLEIVNERRIKRSLFSGKLRPRWWWLVKWLRDAKKQGLKKVIFGHYSAAVLAAYIIHKFFGLQYVILIHGNDLLSENKRWLINPFLGATLRNAKFIGINSSFVENLVHEYGVPLNKIIRTHPFVISNDIPAEISKTTGHRIISVSRLVPRKNIASLLHSVVAIRKNINDVTLDIVGDGPEKDNLVSLTKELNISDKVTFHGAVDEGTKWKLLQNSDVFVMVPTVREQGTDFEGLGLVYLEAAACRLPVVASDTGGVRDAVINEKTGLLVDPSNQQNLTAAIEKLLLNSELAHDFGQAGRELVKKEFTDAVRLARFNISLRGISADRQPLVSVIIPTFQSADTIKATLQSVRNQTYKNIEIIVVDDGSTDLLSEALQEYLPYLKVLHQPNSGAPTARNNGFDKSSGKYILFLDADVVLGPTAIEKMIIALATHLQINFVYSDFYFGWKKFHLFEYSADKLKQQNYIHTASLLRRESFPRFDQSLKRFQDWDLWLTMSEHGHIGGWIPEVLFKVTQRSKKLAISNWLPSFMYKLPGIGQGRGNEAIAKYRQAETVIRQKHKI